MLILHVLPTLDPKAGGLSQAVRNMIRYASSPDLQHEVVCLDPADASYLFEDNFKIHALGKGTTAWNYHGELRSWLDRNLKRYSSILVHGLWQYQSFAVYKSWKKVQTVSVRLFVMPHGMLDPYFQRAKGRRLKAMRNLLFWKFTEKQLVNSADGVLFTCETEKQLARENFQPYLPKKEHVIGLGVQQPPVFTMDMGMHFFKICPELAGIPYLLFLSRIHPKKGLDLLIRAYQSLCSSGQNLPLLLIAGPGLDTPYGREMQQLAEKTSTIYFSGMLEGLAKWGAFYNCEAFVLPSHQENFGIAVVEALACGKPVLISNQVNIYQEIEMEGAGLIGTDHLEGLIKQLEQWLETEPQKREMMGSNAGRCYVKHYSENSAGNILNHILIGPVYAKS
ncbi:glycosyltransferase [Pedobacter sp.]|jgi:glycosyltransferase involved in cell wall biosynthesis|uniref:glycosyltransferase n=1 Tax=Pedobacter sp. TaxID=1411316 RepID=UPI002C70E511|nr:glycosyltransferase [Pedobacter sp.]HWW42113.1 glycosyltransferase [Pedobacter sp.]